MADRLGGGARGIAGDDEQCGPEEGQGGQPRSAQFLLTLPT